MKYDLSIFPNLLATPKTSPSLPKPNLEGQFKMMHNPIEWEI
jgi:hypothetical protein